MPTKQRGFTLVETIVYCAGVIIIIGIVSSMLFYGYSWYRRVYDPSSADQTGVAAVQKILNDVRSGQSIDVGNSIFNTDNGALTINSIENPPSTIAKRYYLSAGRIAYTENGGAIQFVTPSSTQVTQFRVNQLPTPVSMGVRFTIGITYMTKEGTTTSTFTGMATLRNSYQ